MSESRPNNVTTLGWTAFWSGMAQEMVYPLLPIFLVVALASSKNRRPQASSVSSLIKSMGAACGPESMSWASAPAPQMNLLPLRSTAMETAIQVLLMEAFT